MKKYYETYLERYSKMVDTSYHGSAQLIDFYTGLPANVFAYMMPNESVVAIVKLGAAESKVEVFSGRYDQVKTEMRGRAYDYMLPIYPSHPTSQTEIDSTIKSQIEERLRDVSFSQYMKDVTLGIVNIEGQISEISKTNPWLSKQFGELTTMLSDSRRRAEEVSGAAEGMRVRRKFEQFEEVVEWLEAYDISKAPLQLDTVDAEAARTFLTEFIRSYRATIDAKSLAKEAYPAFYSDYPYLVEFFVLPNKGVGAFFVRATEGMRFQERPTGFNEFERDFPTKSYDYFLGLPNCIRFDKASAVKVAQLQAQADLESNDMTMALDEMMFRLKGIEAQIIKIKKSNPWLEQSLSGLLRTLETCNKPITTLKARLEKQRKGGIILRTGINVFAPAIAVYPTTGVTPRGGPVMGEAYPAQVSPAEVYAYPPQQAGEFQVVAPGEYAVTAPYGEQALMGAEAGAGMPATGGVGVAVDSAEFNELKAMLYTFERKLADYEKRLHYIDKYTEMIQRQQNKKFKAQKDLVVLESKKGRWVAIGIGVTALVIGVIVLLANMDTVVDMFAKLFGG